MANRISRRPKPPTPLKATWRSEARAARQHPLNVAALPSSARIKGWRTTRFDEAKTFFSHEAQAHTSMHAHLDPKADIGPSLERIPELVPAVQRVAERYLAGGKKKDIRPVLKLPEGVLDYVIIGAGMAGVSAGAIMADAQHAGVPLRGLVLEGSGRLGGRVRDVEVQGKKVGLGASWIHGKYNTLRLLADALALTRERTYLGREMFVDGRPATPEERLEYERATQAAQEAVGAAERRGSAGPVAKYVPDGKWKGLVVAENGPGEAGVDGDQVDASEATRFASGRDVFLKEGMQSLVVELAKAAELPVVFNARVDQWAQAQDGSWNVRLTDGRQVRAWQVLYTGSTGALGNIDVQPPLPLWKREAVAALPMGNFTKFAFTTEEPYERKHTRRNSWVVNAETHSVTHQIKEDVQFVVKYQGDPRLNIMFAGGRAAERLLAQPKPVLVAWAEGKFSRVAGKVMHIKDIMATPFGQEELLRGSYTAVRPGMAGAHAVYAAPMQGLNFAGEAAGSSQESGSLLAAFHSGVDSAYDIIAALKLKPKSK